MNDLQAKLLAKVDAYDKLFKDTFTGVNYGTALVLECAFNSFRALRVAVEIHEASECWERYKDETPINFLICDGCSDHETEYIVPFPCPELTEIAKEMNEG